MSRRHLDQGGHYFQREDVHPLQISLHFDCLLNHSFALAASGWCPSESETACDSFKSSASVTARG